jgi:hypothetical protein
MRAGDPAGWIRLSRPDADEATSAATMTAATTATTAPFDPSAARLMIPSDLRPQKWRAP